MLLVRYSINRTHYRIICIIRGLMVVTIDTGYIRHIGIYLRFYDCRYLMF